VSTNADVWQKRLFWLIVVLVAAIALLFVIPFILFGVGSGEGTGVHDIPLTTTEK
jgi:uncharacterized membrane protein